MAHVLRPGTGVNQPSQPEASLRIQQSAQGTARTIGWGQNRIAGNLIWYGDFASYAVNTGGGGGKGIGTGGQNSGKYQYQAAVAISLAEGPITSIQNVWLDKSKMSWGDVGHATDKPWGAAANALGMVLFTGSYSQSAWGYLQSLHPTQALNYRGDAYVAAGPLQLGDNPQLPNLSFEVRFAICAEFSGGILAANPRACLDDALTNSTYGVGFPSSRVATNSAWSAYCAGTKLVLSPVLSEQRAFSEELKDWLLATNSEAVWSGSVLKVVPYGDATVLGLDDILALADIYDTDINPDLLNLGGASFVPAAPAYAVGDDDFIVVSANEPPVSLTRTRVEDQNNAVSVEYLDASNDYNPVVVDRKDDAAIQKWGIKQRPLVKLHQITAASTAELCASLLLTREQIRNFYTFTLGSKYMLLEPMDIVSLTDSALGLSAQWVRLREITENADMSLTFVAEEYSAGTGSAPLYGTQPNSGVLPNYNVAPGNVLAPLLFEPTDQLAQGLYVWGAVTGADLTVWGGCEVWASWDGITYAKIDKDMVGASRFGVLTADLATFTAPTQGPAIDTGHTLSVSLSTCQGQLVSGSHADNLAFGALVWVDGEFLSYQDAAVTGSYAYNLTTLNRGGYGSTIGAHSSGAKFCRIDQGVFSVPFTQDRIGQTLYLKFLSFNKYMGGRQALSDVSAFTYVIIGTALVSPLPNVQNFVSSYVGNITYLDWDAINDFRTPIMYEVRKGLSWDGGQVVGVYAHPHVPAVGDATYWIKAVVQPVANLYVYSSAATQLGINGSVVPINVLSNYSETVPLLWPGSVSGFATIDTSVVKTTPSGGNYAQVGYYTIPNSHIINMGRLAPCLVQIIWESNGLVSTTDWFGPSDWFAQTDIFGSAANQFVKVYPEISISADGVNYGPWVKYTAGFYNLWRIKARMRLESLDTNTVAYLTSFKFIVYAPDRTDNLLVNQIIGAGGTTLNFWPDGGPYPSAFNGGPNGAAVPTVSVDILNKNNGDYEVITGLSLSAVTVQIMNAGVGVSRNINVRARGY